MNDCTALLALVGGDALAPSVVPERHSGGDEGASGAPMRGCAAQRSMVLKALVRRGAAVRARAGPRMRVRRRECASVWVILSAGGGAGAVGGRGA